MSEYEIAPEWARVLLEAMSALRAIEGKVQAVSDDFAKRMLPLLSGLCEFQRRIEYWNANAPKVLREQVGAHGLIVPLSQMPLEDLGRLIAVHEHGGGPAVVVLVRQQYDEIFRNDGFLDGLEQAWAADPRLARRLPLLRQALEAHREGKYALSIPVLLAQFEGLVADVAARPPPEKFRIADLQDYVKRVTAEHPLIGQPLSSFVNDVLYAQFWHGNEIPPFSRHAVLHGGDVDYATETNARTAILAIEEIRDYLPRDAFAAPAHHEAGHAVAHLRLGLGPGEVDIIKGRGILGVPQCLDDWDDEERAQAWVVSLYAGYASQVHFDPSDEHGARVGAHVDFERAREILAWLYPDGDLAAREAEWLDRAKTFVAEDKNWRAIEVFARELLAHKRIDGQLVESLLDLADGEITEAEFLRARILGDDGTA